MIILRWVSFIPVAVIAAWVAWFLVSWLNKITFAMTGLDPNSFLSRAFIEFISHAVMGAAFVFVGAKLVPLHNKIVGYILAGIGLVGGGFLLFPAFLISDYWAVWAGVSLVLGVGVTAYSISTGEIEF
jgi:hypothetical protein